MTSGSPSTPSSVARRPGRPRPCLCPSPAAGVVSHRFLPGQPFIPSRVRASAPPAFAERGSGARGPRRGSRLSSGAPTSPSALLSAIPEAVFFSLLFPFCAGHLSPSVCTGAQFALGCAVKITVGVDREGHLSVWRPFLPVLGLQSPDLPVVAFLNCLENTTGDTCLGFYCVFLRPGGYKVEMVCR